MKSGEIVINSVDDRAEVAAILVKNGYAVRPVKKKVGRTTRLVLEFNDADAPSEAEATEDPVSAEMDALEVELDAR